jgi:[ribosomal protein S5]-alanine N-acetyltransferase
MGKTRGWFTALTESSLLGGPLELRPMRIRDVGVCLQARAANTAWLKPWDHSTPGKEEPRQPALAGRLFTALRQSPAAPYAAAAYCRVRAALGLEAYWGIWYKGQFVGQITVFRIAWGPMRSAEVGYWIDQRFGGRGIATAALALTIDHCFLVMGLNRIEACIQPHNVRSRRAVEKLGFREEGLRVGAVHINGAWRDHVAYALLADEVPGGVRVRRAAAVVP